MAGRIVIGLAGVAGSGKTTQAGLLRKQTPWNPKLEVANFADGVKELYFHIYGEFGVLPGAPLTGWRKDIKGEFRETSYGVKTVREMLIGIGNGLRDAVDNDIWVKRLFRIYKERDIVIADVRFPNEVDAIREHGGVVLKLDIPKDEQIRRLSKRGERPELLERWINDKSEQLPSQPDEYFDAVVDGCGTDEEVFRRLELALYHLYRDDRRIAAVLERRYYKELGLDWHDVLAA